MNRTAGFRSRVRDEDGCELVLGIDIGGSATRALVVDHSGRVRGRGATGGGNPVSYSPEPAAEALQAALRHALDGIDVGRVRTAVIGFAGGDLLKDPRVAAPFDAAWRQAGLRCPLEWVDDTKVAFAAGTAEPDGNVLVAGTGAASAVVRNRSVVESVDGHGWLLGDAGSGFWLGRSAVRAALAELDARRIPTSLTETVVRELLGLGAVRSDDRRLASELVAAVHAAPPVTLARLAPLVPAAASAGDEVATRLVCTAVDLLVANVCAVRAAGESTALVVAGGVATADDVLGRDLRARLASEWPGSLCAGTDAAAAAAWLAIRAATGVGDDAARTLHERLVRPHVFGGVG